MNPHLRIIKVPRAASEHTRYVLHHRRLRTNLGQLAVVASEDGVVAVLLPSTAHEVELEALESEPGSMPLLDRATDELFDYCNGRRRSFDLPLDLSLTTSDFQRRILLETALIPYGEKLTYGEVAARAGAPNGSRAAGQALGANPLPILIPCHRIVSADGRLGGFGGGEETKLRLLELEGSPRANWVA